MRSTTPQRNRPSTLRSIGTDTAAPKSQSDLMPPSGAPAPKEVASAAGTPAPELRETVKSAGREEFRPTRQTLPMRPDEAVADELEKLRREYRAKQAAEAGDPAARTRKTEPDRGDGGRGE